MVVALSVAAVEHKAVAAALGRETGINHWARTDEFVHNQAVPLGCLHAMTRVAHHARIVAEVIAQGLHCRKSGRGTRFAISHVRCDAHMRHERCHGIGLDLVVGARDVGVEHIVPVVGGVAKVGAQPLFFFLVHFAKVGELSGSLLGPLVIVHHLGGCCGHTSHSGMGGILAKGGAEVIVWRILVPIGGEQRGDAHGHLGAWRHISRLGVRAQIFHLLCIAI